jgi:Putative 8-oxoguanine DNA glycosylase OGG-like protein
MDEFPGHAAMLSDIPGGRLGRPQVRQACWNAASSPAAALVAFIAIMAWGYGKVGYGPYHVRRVLASVPDPGSRLQVAVGELARGGPVAAYGLLGDNGVPALPGLGPAFGTKFLYFCSPPGGPTALILDSLVAKWLRANTVLRLNEARWSVPTYQRYLATLSRWAAETAVTADELETCIFLAQAKAAGNQWAPR